MKGILKEVCIFVLIIAAIILVIGVLMYDYIPTSKVVPQTVSYQTPENLQEEIKEELIEDNSEVIVTYEVNSYDLKEYQKESSYDPGKLNPFDVFGAGAGDPNIDLDEEFFNNNKTK